MAAMAAELAPFISAVLGDEELMNMHIKNEALRQELEEMKAVKITGSNGEPLYFRGQLNPNSDKSNTVYDPLESFPCNLSDLRGVELQNGGMIRADFRLNHSVECEIRVSALEEDADNSRRNEGEDENENEKIFEARFQPGPVRIIFCVRSTNEEQIPSTFDINTMTLEQFFQNMVGIVGECTFKKVLLSPTAEKIMTQTTS